MMTQQQADPPATPMAVRDVLLLGTHLKRDSA